MKLTSDNRLIDSVEKDRLQGIKSKMEAYAESRLYQSVLNSIGIDLLGILKLDISDESATIEEMYTKAINSNTGLFCGENQMRANFSSIQDVINNPQAMLGVIALGDTYGDRDPDMNRQKQYNKNRTASMFMMLIHKNGDLRICGVSEFKSESIETKVLNGLADNMKQGDKYNMEGRVIITIDSTISPKVLNIGNHISNREKQKVANMILESKFEYWLDSTATKKLIAKLGKQNTLSKLKQAGVHTLSVPLTLPVIADAVGVAVIASLYEAVGSERERISKLSPEKQIGYMRGPLHGRINEAMIDGIEKIANQ